jgi:hypothetical protein
LFLIEDALRQIEHFRGSSLAKTIADIETRLVGATRKDTIAVNTALHLDKPLISSAAQVKRASAQIDVIIHTLGILYSLPYLLEEGEFVETTSLGAGNAGSEFDLVTNRRIAEFKFIYWQGGSESIRKKTFFQDYFKLIRAHSQKSKYFYLLNIEIPLRFLKGKSISLRMLDRDHRLATSFQQLYSEKFPTVGEYYIAHKDQVKFVNLIDVVPDLMLLVGLAALEDEAA